MKTGQQEGIGIIIIIIVIIIIGIINTEHLKKIKGIMKRQKYI